MIRNQLRRLFVCIFMAAATPVLAQGPDLEDLAGKAAAGDGVAAMMLGNAYDLGEGVPQNLDMARHWYERAAELYQPDAMENLAKMYRWGRGVPEDVAKAEEWERRAAKASGR